MHQYDEQTLKVFASLTNVKPSSEQVERIEALRKTAKELAHVIGTHVTAEHERNLTFNHLEEMVMWAVKGIVMEVEP